MNNGDLGVEYDLRSQGDREIGDSSGKTKATSFGVHPPLQFPESNVILRMEQESPLSHRGDNRRGEARVKVQVGGGGLAAGPGCCLSNYDLSGFSLAP